MIKIDSDFEERAIDLRIKWFLEASSIENKASYLIELQGLQDGANYIQKAITRNKIIDLLKKGTESDHFSAMQEVVPGLFIGPSSPAFNLGYLQENNITHILMCIDARPPFELHFNYLVIPIDDHPQQEIKSKFSETYLFISKARKEENGKVYVHCAAGISRSASIVVAYLMKEYQISAKLALAVLKAARHFCSPNIGFSKQLLEYERELNLDKLSSSQN